MAYREFLDGEGTMWKAWDTYPDLARRISVTPGHEKGWLSFDNGTDRRRMAPIPAGWVGATEAELRAWLAAAAGIVLTQPSDERRPGAATQGG